MKRNTSNEIMGEQHFRKMEHNMQKHKGRKKYECGEGLSKTTSSAVLLEYKVFKGHGLK